MATSTSIPFVYRLVFTYIDPIFCALGVITHVLAPVKTIEGYSPLFLSPPRTETIHLLDSMAGFFAMFAVIEGVLLRVRATDGTVWRIVQTGGVFVDLFMTIGCVRMLATEGRLDYGAWRGDDWRLGVGNAGMGLLRLACAMGWGFTEVKGKRS